MTDSRQHAESTTLQPCRTAAVVGDTIYVRSACPRYAAASCLCRSLSSLAPHHTTRFCCAASLGARVHRCGNIGTFLCNSNNLDTIPSVYIYVQRGSSLTSISSVVFAKIADGRQQTTCGEQNATGRTMCVRVLYPLFTAVSCFFVTAYVTCYCPLAPSFSIRAASHATRAPARFLAVPKLEFEL